MKKNAFTLVELIAVLVILSIIALLATPNIINLMQSGKEKSLLTDVEEMVSNATYMYKNENVRGFSASIFDYDENSEMYTITIGNIRGTIPDNDPYGYTYDKENSYIGFKESSDDSGIRKTIVFVKACNQENKCHCVKTEDGNNLTPENITEEDCTN